VEEIARCSFSPLMSNPDPPGPPPPTRRPLDHVVRYSGLGCVLFGALGAAAIGRAFKSGASQAWLPQSVPYAICDVASTGLHDRLRLFAVGSEWLATVVLEGVVAAIGLALACGSIASLGGKVWRRWEWVVLLGAGASAILLDVHDVQQLLQRSDRHMFLHDLLSTLPDRCLHVRELIRWARMIGEPSGILIGVSMCGLAGFARWPTEEELARRLGWLHRLLYGASLLFVVGIMMSRANFTFVLAHWSADDPDVDKALTEMIRVGVLQSGVGYSALLAIFFLPARVFLDLLVGNLIPASVKEDPVARKKWLDDHELSRSWLDDVRQILALLAPVLSAPVFEALAKKAG